MKPPPTHVHTAGAEPGPSAELELGRRLYRALGPVAGGLVLDFADLVTFGPFGLAGGLVVGGLVGWWMTSQYRFGTPLRTGLAVLAGLYCALPFTHFLPVATLLTAVMRFLEDPLEAEDGEATD